MIFIGISFLWYFALWWGAIPLTLVYLWRYPGYELVLLGALIDIQFLTGIAIPYYTLGFIALVVAAIIIKPLLRPRAITYEIE
jgi:hypothetical protein